MLQMKHIFATLLFVGLMHTVSMTPCLAQSVSVYEAYLTVPFYTRSDSEFTITKTFYVAAQQPGASNTNDGLVPTYQGNGHGPFRDLAALDPLLALSSAEGTKVVLRQGLYVPESSGLVLRSSKDEFRPFILAGYPGETAILDGTGLHSTLVIDGQYTIVENLTIRNGSQYNVRVGGQYTIIRNNILQGASDSIKMLTGADHGFIYSNDISAFTSTGIDQFGADYWLIKSNGIHNGVGALSGLFTKGGTHYTLIVDNDIHDFVQVTPTGSSGILLGGSSNSAWQRRDGQGNLLAEATYAVALNNHIWNIPANGIQFNGCVDCIAESNTIYNTYYGILMTPGNDPTFSPYDTAGEPGTQRATIKDNKFFGVATNIVFFIWPGAETGIQAQGNVYYNNVVPEGRYGITPVAYQSNAWYQQAVQVQPASQFTP